MLTIEKLAERANITDNFLGKIERGEGMPSLPTIDSIACALDVSIYFLKGKIEYYTKHKFIKHIRKITN